MEPSVTITIKSITTDSIFRIKGHDREDSAEKITLPNKYVPILQPTTYELAKFSVAKNSSYSTLYASNEISCTEATKNINKTIMNKVTKETEGLIIDNEKNKIASVICDAASHDLLNPMYVPKKGIFKLLIRGDQRKFAATINPPKESKPMSDRSIPSTLSHLVKAAPVTKYGSEADTPKRIKLNGIFLLNNI